MSEVEKLLASMREALPHMRDACLFHEADVLATNIERLEAAIAADKQAQPSGEVVENHSIRCDNCGDVAHVQIVRRS